MKFILHKPAEKVSIHCKDNIVYMINGSFQSLTGYSDNEVIGKSIEQLSILLKLDSQISLTKLENPYNCYLFMKRSKPKEINISSKYIIDKEEKIYYLGEVPNSSLNYMIENSFSLNLDNKKSIAIYSLDDYILLQSNKQYMELLSSLNIPTDNLMGKPPACPDFLLNCGNNVKYGYETEVEFINKDQSVVYFDLSTVPLYINGKEKYLLNIIYDVTDKVLARRKVEKQKKQLEIIIENVSDRISIFNNNGDDIYTNKSDYNIINNVFNDNNPESSKNDFGGLKFNTLEGNEIPFDLTPVQRVLKGERFFNYMFLGTNDYSTVYQNAHGVPLYDNRGNIDGGVLIYEDITHKMVLEEYNVLKERTKNTLLNYANLSYPDFKIMYVNDEAYKNFKYSNPNIKDLLSVIGKNFFEFYDLSKDEEFNLINNIKKSIEEKSSSAITYTHKIVRNGKCIYLKTIFHPIYNENKEVDKIVMVGIDVTKEKRSNEKLDKAIKIQEDIFVNISHEFKTPLNVIFSASQLLNMYLEKDLFESIKDNIIYNNKIIIQNCYRLTKLINNILDISKIESGFYELDLTNEDIVNVTEDIIGSVSKYIDKMRLNIVFDTDIEEKVIALDLHKFERIMLNLISNAIKFSNPGGTIFVNLYDKDNSIEISVKDQGIGISKENLPNIFDKFHQVNKSLNRKAEGTGIGLSLVKSLVELHDGKINAESTLGKGSTFTLKLPATIVDKQNDNKSEINNKNRTEMIKFELSDIY